MGRLAPCSTALPNHTRRAERSARAKDTIHKAIPEILRGSPRARHGIHQAERISDPAATSTAAMAGQRTHIKIRVQCCDTLTAAAQMSDRPFQKKTQRTTNVAVLNFASPLRPGGGFLDGANSQEEFICARTTLYPSLWDHFYRLPEVGGIFTPEVMVFRDSAPEANEIPKRDRFFVDMISAGMIRFPDTRGRSMDREPTCSCGVSYCDRDRELVTEKMKAVLRIAELKGSKKLVLGAWGCGAYGNPVTEVAKIWRKVIAGGPRQRKPNAESWAGIEEIVFAIPDRNMIREFEKSFEDILVKEAPVSVPVVDVAAKEETDELLSKIAATELQLDLATNSKVKARLREVLAALNRDLTRGFAKDASDEDLTLEEDEEVDDFVVCGSGADNVYNFDEHDIPSDSSEGEHSEIYEFRPQLEEKDSCVAEVSLVCPSPKFDVETGWYEGSMDDLTRLLKKSNVLVNSGSRSGHSSPYQTSPGHDEITINAYLSRYGGSDALSAASSVM